MCKNNMKVILALTLSTLLQGCLSTPTVEFDPNEKILFGKIVNKKLISNTAELLEQEKSANQEYLIERGYMVSAGTGISGAEGIAAVIILNTLGLDNSDGPTLPAAPVSYQVISKSGQQYLVINKFTGFKVGDCVKIFVSDNAKKYPPRIAHGNQCSKNT